MGSAALLGWMMVDVAGDRRFPIAGCRELWLLRPCSSPPYLCLSGGRCRPKGRARRSRPPPSCHRSATRNLFGQAAGGIRKGRPWAARQAPPSSQLPPVKAYLNALSFLFIIFSFYLLLLKRKYYQTSCKTHHHEIGV